MMPHLSPDLSPGWGKRLFLKILKSSMKSRLRGIKQKK